MDANGNIIPIVEDDQGEGFKDPVEDFEDLAKVLVVDERPEKDALKEFLNDPGSKVKQRKAMVEGLSKPKEAQRFKMKKGMPIDFMGHRYKVISVKKSRKGERVLLKYIRELR